MQQPAKDAAGPCAPLPEALLKRLEGMEARQREMLQLVAACEKRIAAAERGCGRVDLLASEHETLKAVAAQLETQVAAGTMPKRVCMMAAEHEEVKTMAAGLESRVASVEAGQMAAVATRLDQLTSDHEAVKALATRLESVLAPCGATSDKASDNVYRRLEQLIVEHEELKAHAAMLESTVASAARVQQLASEHEDVKALATRVEARLASQDAAQEPTADDVSTAPETASNAAPPDAGGGSISARLVQVEEPSTIDVSLQLKAMPTAAYPDAAGGLIPAQVVTVLNASGGASSSEAGNGSARELEPAAVPGGAKQRDLEFPLEAEAPQNEFAIEISPEAEKLLKEASEIREALDQRVTMLESRLEEEEAKHSTAVDELNQRLQQAGSQAQAQARAALSQREDFASRSAHLQAEVQAARLEAAEKQRQVDALVQENAVLMAQQAECLRKAEMKVEEVTRQCHEQLLAKNIEFENLKTEHLAAKQQLSASCEWNPFRLQIR